VTSSVISSRDTAAAELVVRQQAYHQSTVKELTGGCSWKWKLRYIDGLEDPSGWPALIGTNAHAAFELHEQERIDARLEGRPSVEVSEDQMVAAAQAALAAADIGEQEDYGDGRPYNLATAQAAVERAVTYWWHEPIPAGQPGAGTTIRDRVMAWVPVAVEPHFRVWVPGLSKPIGGWIDGVYFDPDARRFRLVDEKTADNFGRWPTDGTVSRLQPAQYALGAKLSTSLPVWDLPAWEFHVMRTRPKGNSRFQAVRVIPVDVDEHDVDWIIGKVREADAIVQAGAFQPEPDKMGPLCSKRWCPFFEAAGSPCPARPAPFEAHPELASQLAAALLPTVEPAPTSHEDPFVGVAEVFYNADGSEVPF